MSNDDQLELLTVRGEVLRFEPLREEAPETPMLPSETPTPQTGTPEPNVTISPFGDPQLHSFKATLIQAVETQDIELMQSLMGDSFSLAVWTSEGWTLTSAEAIQELQRNYLLADNAVRFVNPPDPSLYLDGRDSLTVWNPVVNPVSALFAVGWGTDGQAEAFLIVAQRPDGTFYWDGILVALGGFADQQTGPHPISTPTPYMDVWITYSNPAYGITLEYPADWEPVPGFVGPEDRPIKFAAISGFFHVNAMDAPTIDDAALAEAEHHLQPYGSQPTVESLQLEGQEARLILPSVDQAAGMHYQAALIVRYPNPLDIVGNTCRFFVLWADVSHIRTFAQTVHFTTDP